MFRPWYTSAPAMGLASIVLCLSSGAALAQTSTSSAAVAAKRTRLQAAFDQLAASQADRHRAWRNSEAAQHKKVRGLEMAVESAPPTDQAFRLFTQSTGLLSKRVDNLQRALGRLREINLSSQSLRSSAALFPTLLSELDALEETDRSLRHTLLIGPYNDVHRIVELRAILIDRLPEEQRDVLQKWSADTQASLHIEISTVLAMTEAHAHRIVYRLSNLSEMRNELDWMSTLLSLLFIVVLMLALIIWLRNQIPDVLTKLRLYEYQQARTVERVRQIEALVRLVSNFGTVAVNILAVHAFSAVIASRFSYIEVKVAFAIAFWIVYYRLAHRVCEVLIYRVARRRFRVTLNTRQRIAQSIFFVGRIVLSGGLVLSVIHAVTNFGMIYYWVRDVVAFAMFIAALILLNRWRPSIVAIYIEKAPKGALSNWVKKAKDKPYGFFVVCAAFVYVATHGLFVLLRDTVLSFEQSRKALAFFFRRRLERHAEEVGLWDEEISKLPPTLLSSFTLSPLSDASLRVDNFPGFEKFESMYNRWLQFKMKGAVLVTAPLGYGKTTWLNRAVEIDDLEHLWLNLSRPATKQPTLASHFLELYQLESEDFESLVDAVLSGPRCVMVLDDCHNVITRGIGGCGLFEELMQLIEATGHHVFWLCAMDSLAWKYVCVSRPQRPWFREVITLSDWSDEQISQLIMARAAASGVVHCFEDLITEESQEKSERRLAEIGESYARLIWDSSDGCPWVALHYWQRSLAPVSAKKVRVRLFRRPSLTRLEKWPKEAVFLYAAIALHSRLSVSEVAGVLRYSKSLCETFLNQGCEEGYLVCDEQGRYHLNVNWYRPIIHFLKQRHAVEDVQ